MINNHISKIVIDESAPLFSLFGLDFDDDLTASSVCHASFEYGFALWLIAERAQPSEFGDSCTRSDVAYSIIHRVIGHLFKAGILQASTTRENELRMRQSVVDMFIDPLIGCIAGIEDGHREETGWPRFIPFEPSEIKTALWGHREIDWCRSAD